MKNLFSILLISFILYGCADDPLNKSVVVPLEIEELQKIREFADEQEYTFPVMFDIFYERIQDFHKLTENDNLSRVKFVDVLFQHWFDKEEYEYYCIYRDQYIYKDSITSLQNKWKVIQKYINICDTLSSVKLVERIWKEDDIYIKKKTDEIMREYIQEEIEMINDSLNFLHEIGKSSEIKLLEEFNSKRIELKVKSRYRR